MCEDSPSTLYLLGPSLGNVVFSLMKFCHYSTYHYLGNSYDTQGCCHLCSVDKQCLIIVQFVNINIILNYMNLYLIVISALEIESIALACILNVWIR